LLIWAGYSADMGCMLAQVDATHWLKYDEGDELRCY